MCPFEETISEHVWQTKYRYQLNHKIIDKTIEDTWLRVATAVASVEKHQQKTWQQAFYDILENFSFLPGGRILAGAGTRHRVTLFNCFVMPILKDSLPGIFDALKEGALTLQQGGGVGYDFSPLRPAGFPALHTGTDASGPLSFMRIWNAMCATMLSTGARRGAMMGILRCDHPDIEAFIDIKKNPQELRHFNISVLVTDAFMQAVARDEDWALVFPIKARRSSGETIDRRWSGSPALIRCEIIKRVKARMLWEKIITAAYDYAEPGVIFEDTVNLNNTLWYREWISATNPCGEIPLPAYGACNLGSLNLTQFVHAAFTEKATIDFEKLKKTTAIATRFLDNVIDISNYPLHAQQQESLATRRIGLGISGLADALVMLGLSYGSDEGVKTAQACMQIIAETTWQTSIHLAEERGSFPLFQKEKYLAGHFVKNLPIELQEAIAKHGIRNSHHNTIAPTGTISLLANNISNGIEPIFSGVYERTIRTTQVGLLNFSMKDHSLRQWQKLNQDTSFPPAWTDAHALTPQAHLRMQAALQPYIDNAISKTINIPINFPFHELKAVYTEAHQLGLKGCTIYRPNLITGSVLQLSEENPSADSCCTF